MTIKFLQTVAGEHGLFNVGQSADLPEDQASRWIARGWAAPIDGNPVREAVDASPKKRKAVQK